MALGVAALVILLTAGVAVFLLGPAWQSEDIATPPDDATPEQVVAAYLDALDANDCDTATAVSMTNARVQGAAWCEDVAGLKGVTVGNHTQEEPEHSGHALNDQVVRVPVTFDLNWRAFHGDVSMPEGSTRWAYLLVRNSPDAPWRIFDQGNG